MNAAIISDSINAVPLCGSLCHQASTKSSTAPNQVTDFFSKIFNTVDFPARWHCGNWTDFHGWLYIMSDLAIWAAYFAIPVMLIRVMIKRKDIALTGVISLFLAFVFLCGLTHLIDAVIFWWPAYRLSALLRLATAIVSIIAASILNRIFPVLLGLRSVKELKIEIAKRKKTEERLSASEFLLLEAGRIARVGGWEYDLISKKHNWSNTVKDILGIPYNYDIYQVNPLSFYLPPFHDLLEQATVEAVENGKKWDIEALAVTMTNKTLWVRHIGEPVFNHQGQVIKVRGTLTDIDQYKKHELELSRALEATQKKTERLQKFSHILSHNIRNHTSNLTALADLIEIEELNEANKEVALKNKQVIQALNTTLNDLAQAMDVQEKSAVKESISFDLSASKAIQALSPQIKQSNAQITQSFSVPNIDFPSLYLDNIVKHLLSNAICYADPTRKLQIDFSSYLNDNGQVVLECQDTGLGIDMERNGYKLFNLYATFHPHISNRGVGLFLLKTQIESQGGEITVSSMLGEGSTFKVIFQRIN